MNTDTEPKYFLRRNISSYTNEQNTRMKSKWKEKTHSVLEASIQTIKQKNLAIKINNKDLDTMILKLDRISKNSACGIVALELFDKDSLNVDLIEGESQVIKMTALGNLTPLNVLIENLEGKIEVYVSRKIKVPNKIVNDFICRTNYFRINEPKYKFLIPFAYLNFFAVKNSRFTIKVWFGTIFQKSKGGHIPRHQDFELETEDDEEFKRGLENDSLKQEKNFVELNKYGISPTKFVKANWNSKFLNAKNKKAALFEKSQSDIFYKVNKKEIELYIEKKNCQITGTLQRKDYFERNWLKLLYVSKFCTQLSVKYSAKKMLQRKFALMMGSVIKIQIMAKRFIYKGSTAKVCMRIARKNLRLFHHTHQKLMKRYLIRFLAWEVSRKIQVGITAAHCAKFLKTVKFIQYHWYRYRLNDDFRLQEVLSVFQSALQKKIKLIDRKNKKKAEGEIVNPYKDIDDKMLRKLAIAHMDMARIRFRSNIRSFLENASPKMKIRERIDMLKKGKHIAVAKFPQYIYGIEMKEALQIIEKCVQ